MILFLVITLPLLSFILLQVGKRFFRKNSGAVATACASLSFFFSFILLLNGSSNFYNSLAWQWLKLGEIQVNIQLNVDHISLKMLIVINAISALVHLFSTTYMKGDKHFVRYFSYLGLFTFAMNAMVIMDNLILFYFFWELVGFSSYLLIGFWQHKKSAASAAKKAFIINRIGDAFFLIGIMMAHWAGTTSISELSQVIFDNLSVTYIHLVGIGLCFFLGAMAKSAQLPLAIWLPDAMEGPTPVSALIHAATMVAAGVYLLVRVSFLLTTPEVLAIISIVGSLTAFLAAIAAVFQYDIKKVLAYSTISQLGFMITAIGLATPDVALFHLTTHAFFKASLFLSAGSIIHALHAAPNDPQDLRNMGGLRKKLPTTFFALMLSGASLAGLPLFSGFLSKEAILLATENHSLIAILLFSASFLTAFYISRLIILSMWGKLPEQLSNIIQPPKAAIKIPLIILSLMSLWIGFSLSPFDTRNNWWVNINSALPSSYTVFIFSIVLAVSGIISATGVYTTEKGKQFKKQLSNLLDPIQNMGLNFFYFDKLFAKKIPDLVTRFSVFTFNSEKKVLDGFIDHLAVFVVVLGHISRWVDKFIIDGFVNVISQSIYKTGGFTGGFQGKAIQTLVIGTIVLLVSIGLLFYGIFSSVV